MNSLRALPILNRPSRPSSPAPASTTAVNVSSMPPPIHPHPHDERRSRSLSRTVTDKMAALQVSGAPPQQTHTLPSQPLGKRISPPNSRPVTPRVSEGNVPQGGYMEALGLRLNEAVNQACQGVDFRAKKGFKQHVGWSVGETIVKELPYPVNDAYLMRAVLRTTLRSLSIYTNRLESLLLPSLMDPTFSHPFNLQPTSTSHPLNPAQYFALSVAHAAWETSEVLEETLASGKWPGYVQDALKPPLHQLDLVVSKVVNPFLVSLKKDLVGALNRTEGTSPPGGKSVGLASIPAPTTVPLTKEHSHPPQSRSKDGRITKEPSDRGHSRQLAIPAMLQHFANRVDGSRKVLEIIAGPCREDGEGWVTGVVVAVTWKGLIMISEKESILPGNRPPSPGSVSKALNSLGKEKDATPAVVASGSLSGVAAKMNALAILPSRAQSRPPSPPRGAHKYDPTTLATLSFEGLIKRLIHGLINIPTHPHDHEAAGHVHVAGEAVYEALEAITSFHIIASALHSPVSSARILASARRIRDDIDDPLDEKLDDAMEDIPAPLLFKIIRDQANYALSQVHSSHHGGQPHRENEHVHSIRIRSPAQLVGWTPEQFEQRAMAGFGTAEEWSLRVAEILKPEVEAVLLKLEAIHKEQPGNGNGKGMEGLEWVKALGVVMDARTNVKVHGAT